VVCDFLVGGFDDSTFLFFCASEAEFDTFSKPRFKSIRFELMSVSKRVETLKRFEAN
jgi:hypothetical protein